MVRDVIHCSRFFQNWRSPGLIKIFWRICIFVPRGRAPFGQHQESRPLAKLWLHSGQTTGHSREHARDLRTSGHFPSSSHKISMVKLRHSSHLGTKFNHSAHTNVLFPSFTAFLIRKSAPRETNDNYHDKNTSLHVSLRTRKFDKKIHYCCRDSFFVEKDI